MTEDEARKTWCPQTDRGRYPVEPLHPSQCCVMSDCGWWVWDKEYDIDAIKAARTKYQWTLQEARDFMGNEQFKFNTGHCGAIK